jgi:type II secretory pathway component GspD/PulD (secretin)
MNITTLRWLCAIASACILTLVPQAGSKRSAASQAPAPVLAATTPVAARATDTPAPSKTEELQVARDITEKFLPPPAPQPQAAVAAPRFELAALTPQATPVPQLPNAATLGAVPQAIPLPADVPVPGPVPAAEPIQLLEGAPAAQAALVSQTPAGTQITPAMLSGNPSLSALPELAADGYWIENAPLNEIFQYLARRAEKQYFFNNDLAGPAFSVTGHLKLTDPKKQMEDLAVAYGLTVHEQNGTIYLLTEEQLVRLPVEVMCYTLKYLRGARPGTAVTQPPSGGGEGEDGGHGGGGSGGDFTKLMAIIKPILTKDTGHIEFEEKNNVLLVTDNAPKLMKVRALLEQIDKPKQQIVINVRILRVRNSHGSKIGVDWSSVLGEDGLPIRASQSLNAMFGLPDSATLTRSILAAKDINRSYNRARETISGNGSLSDITTTNDNFSRETSNSESTDRLAQYTDGVGLVFDAIDMEAIIHALNNNDIVSQEACPTIITEDNEQGIVSFVDRFPIVTSTIVATASGTNVTDEVRYKIDDEDPNAAQEPEKSREIGVTLSVTPTLLPDGTVRMRLRPRVANIIDFVQGPSGNNFPRVSESTIEGISRIPKGKSLFLGGFFDSDVDNRTNRVPILGNIPVMNRLFSYKNKNSEQISLVFIITPQVYDASNPDALGPVNTRVQWDSGFNRPDPLGPATPILPEPSVENGGLPSPMNADAIPKAISDKQRRPWVRWFSKKPAAE